MKIRFLVLLAVLCLSVHLSSAHKEASQPEKAAAKPEKAAAKAEKKAKAKPEYVEIEEIEIRKKKKDVEKKQEKKKHFEVKREVKKKPGKQISCAETTKEEKADCDKATTAGYKPIFHFVDKGDCCEWTCDYELLPTAAPVQHKKLVKKLKEKAPKEKKKECSGDKKIMFSNCLVSIKGLIAWGDKTRNFDQKFEKLLQKKAKKAKKTK